MQALRDKPHLKQFIKFCIVGVSNVILDFSVFNLLAFHFGLYWVLATCMSFLVAVSNSFYWNRRWTFNAAQQGKSQQRYALFVLINIGGLLLNLTIMKTVMLLLTGAWNHELSPQVANTAKLAATAVVVFWNFFANKHWTFKPESTPE